MLPFGEHKGYGLALVAASCSAVRSRRARRRASPTRASGACSTACSRSSSIPSGSAAGDAFGRETEEFIEWCLASPPGVDVDRVKLAGEPEREKKKARAAEGIAVDPATWEEILVSADKLKFPRAEVQKLAGV